MFVLNGNTEKIVGLLRKCGLTEYESKAYFTLLLIDRAKMWDLSKKSSVPQSKIYWVMNSLERKGLVFQVEEFPKTMSALPFGQYLNDAINLRQKEITGIIEDGNELREILQVLRLIAIRYNRFKVFEPKYRRRQMISQLVTYISDSQLEAWHLKNIKNYLIH